MSVSTSGGVFWRTASRTFSQLSTGRTRQWSGGQGNSSSGTSGETSRYSKDEQRTAQSSQASNKANSATDKVRDGWVDGTESTRSGETKEDSVQEDKSRESCVQSEHHPWEGFVF